MHLIRYVGVAFCCLVSTLGCGGRATTTPLRFDLTRRAVLEGVASCSPIQQSELKIDPNRPLSIIVHGCFSSGGRFRNLAQVFAFHGQQTVCFNYDDRDSLRATGLALQNVLVRLSEEMPGQAITLLGHSQGGLIARIALSDWNELPAGADIQLVTVSSPFSGIEAAEHCGWPLLHVATLGITVGVCLAITGSKWTEIHPSSRIWTKPKPFQRAVTRHLMVVTNERDTCRTWDEDGVCDEDDYVFSLSEQENIKLLKDPRTKTLRISAGHVEIVGEQEVDPRKLIDVLQREQLLERTPPSRRAALARLMNRLFGAT